MRQILRLMPVAVCGALTFAPALLCTAQAADCRRSAIETLQTLAPGGYAVYREIKDKDFFRNWITCDNVQLGLSTAVHESVHFITAEDDAFPLVNGGEIKRPHEVSGFFAPALIANRFGASDFATTYLRAGRSSSATDFLYLLDELNAYSHDLNTAVHLETLRPAGEDVDNRDGLAAAMAFVAVYAQTAEESQPATWSGLQAPAVAHVVSEIWGRAETVMASSCGIPRFGTLDKTFIRQFCQAKVQASLRTIIGRPTVCPVACLTGRPQPQQTDEVVAGTTDDGAPRRDPEHHLSAVRSFWGRLFNPRAAGDDAMVEGRTGTTR